MPSWPILLVDDEEIILESLGKSLRHIGYIVEMAPSGEEAISKLKADGFDLIITDLVMPGKGGLEVLAAAKEINPDCAVIILTAHGNMSSAVKSLRLGADDYLCKPCDKDELVSRIERCLEVVRMKEALRESYDLLELKVRERTIELEELNTALNVLLKKREKDQKLLEERVVANLKQLVHPYLTKMKTNSLLPAQQTCLEVIEENLKAITSSFSVDYTSTHYRLSPTELQVANLVCQGRSSREIADLMNLSIETIHNHRKHIRKKIGLTQKNISLHAVLSKYPNKNHL